MEWVDEIIKYIILDVFWCVDSESTLKFGLEWLFEALWDTQSVIFGLFYNNIDIIIKYIILDVFWCVDSKSTLIFSLGWLFEALWDTQSVIFGIF